MVKGAKQHITNSIRFRRDKPASRGFIRLDHFVITAHYTHIFATLVLLRKTLYGLQKRRQSKTLCAILFEFGKNGIIYIDNKYKSQYSRNMENTMKLIGKKVY